MTELSAVDWLRRQTARYDLRHEATMLSAIADRLETLERENARLQEVAGRVMASEEYCVNRQRLGKDCGECLYCTARKALEKP